MGVLRVGCCGPLGPPPRMRWWPMKVSVSVGIPYAKHVMEPGASCSLGREVSQGISTTSTVVTELQDCSYQQSPEPMFNSYDHNWTWRK